MPTSMYKRPGSHGSLWIERSVSKRVRISVKNTGSKTSMPQELLFELNGARVTPQARNRFVIFSAYGRGYALFIGDFVGEQFGVRRR